MERKAEAVDLDGIEWRECPKKGIQADQLTDTAYVRVTTRSGSVYVFRRVKPKKDAATVRDPARAHYVTICTGPQNREEEMEGATGMPMGGFVPGQPVYLEYGTLATFKSSRITKIEVSEELPDSDKEERIANLVGRLYSDDIIGITQGLHVQMPEHIHLHSSIARNVLPNLIELHSRISDIVVKLWKDIQAQNMTAYTPELLDEIAELFNYYFRYRLNSPCGALVQLHKKIFEIKDRQGQSIYYEIFFVRNNAQNAVFNFELRRIVPGEVGDRTGEEEDELSV